MTDKELFDRENIFGKGQANDAYAPYFDGNSFLNPLVDADSPLFLANVTFEPGKVIVIPANTKHWHGAKKDSWFSHISLEVPGENTSNTWLEAVSEEDYSNL